MAYDKSNIEVLDGFCGFLRRYSIDETPQLLQVVMGQMNLTGPRPLTQSEIDTYYGDAARLVFQLKPGLIGLWQTMGRNRLRYYQRRRLDEFLARHYSCGLRLYLIATGIMTVLRGEGR